MVIFICFLKSKRTILYENGSTPSFFLKKNNLIKMVRVFWRKIIKNINCMAPHKNHTPIVNTVQVFNN